MNFNLNLGQWIVIALSAILLVWYFWANSANRKRGTATYRWLRSSLETIGEISDAEWIGAANMGARLTVKKAKKPFRRVEAHYLLEPREFPPYWLYSRLRGKRDEIVIQFTLRSAPKGSFEIRRKIGLQSTKTDASETESAQIMVPSGEKFSITSDRQVNEGLLAAVEAFVKDRSEGIEFISLQTEAPHLVLHARLVPLLRSPAESFFPPVQNWFQEN